MHLFHTPKTKHVTKGMGSFEPFIPQYQDQYNLNGYIYVYVCLYVLPISIHYNPLVLMLILHCTGSYLSTKPILHLLYEHYCPFLPTLSNKNYTIPKNFVCFRQMQTSKIIWFSSLICLLSLGNHYSLSVFD